MFLVFVEGKTRHDDAGHPSDIMVCSLPPGRSIIVSLTSTTTLFELSKARQ